MADYIHTDTSEMSLSAVKLPLRVLCCGLSLLCTVMAVLIEDAA